MSGRLCRDADFFCAEICLTTVVPVLCAASKYFCGSTIYGLLTLGWIDALATILKAGHWNLPMCMVGLQITNGSQSLFLARRCLDTCIPVQVPILLHLQGSYSTLPDSHVFVQFLE